MARTSGRARAVLMALAVAGAVGWPAIDAQQAPPAPSPGTGMIAGRVVDADTRQPVHGAVVTLAAIGAPTGPGGPRPAPIRPVKTDSQGRFVFTNLAVGNYAHLAQLEGYSGLPSRDTTSLTSGATVTNLTITLTRLGTISGTVRDDGGDPVVGVEVVAFRRTTLQGRPPVLAGDGRSRTDDLGHYRITNLQPVEYYICACNREPIPFDGQLLTTLAARPLDLLAVAGRAAKAGADAASIDTTLRTFAPTFHPNTPLASRAVRVKATGAQPQSAIDIEVSAVRAARVSGMVLGAANNSFYAGALSLIPVGDLPEAAAITQLVPMLVQPDGRFDFVGVAPGQYLLEARFMPGRAGGGPSGAALAFIGGRGTAAASGARGGQSPADSMWASQVVSVGEEDVTGLVVGMQPGATITGRLEFVGNSPPPPPAPPVQPGQPITTRPNGIQLNPLDAPPRGRAFTTTVTPDGTFQLPGVVPGRYVVSPAINVPGWPTLQSITLGGVDITDTLLDIDGRDLANLVVTVTDVPLAEIRGTLATSFGNAEAETWIRLFPVERKYWDEPFGAFARFKNMRVENNSFTLARIPAGEYYLIAVSEGGLEWMDKATLDAMARSAERVRVVNGDKKVLEVRR